MLSLIKYCLLFLFEMSDREPKIKPMPPPNVAAIGVIIIPTKLSEQFPI